MKLIEKPADLEPRGRKIAAAIGVFDGVHLGHQQVLRQTISDARQHAGLALAITFDRHPSAVVAPDRAPPLVYSLAQKLRTITSIGIDVTWLIHFDEAFSRRSADDFVRGLVRDFGNVCSLCVGSAFTFGHKRSGNVATLRALGNELGFIVHGLASIALDGQVVSSTRVRDAVKTGNFDAASQMLGRAYSLAGIVVRGDQLGGQLGFPTANIEVENRVLPPSGVYAAQTTVRGRQHRSVLNIGRRPTLGNDQPPLRVEVHVLDFSGDLYGEELEVFFADRLRDEMCFPSLDALREQIGRDVEAARAVL